MKRMLIAVAISGALLSAQRIPARQKAQQQRIEQGVRSGELTRREAVKLEAKEARLAREVRKDRIDGPGLTPKERVKIEKKQDRLSREIYREKHDGQTRK